MVKALHSSLLQPLCGVLSQQEHRLLVTGVIPRYCPRPLCKSRYVDLPRSPLTLPLLLRRPLSSAVQNCTRELRSLIFLIGPLQYSILVGLDPSMLPKRRGNTSPLNRILLLRIHTCFSLLGCSCSRFLVLLSQRPLCFLLLLVLRCAGLLCGPPHAAQRHEGL